MKLSQIKANPKNPRVIKDQKYKKLLSSLKEFPKMLELRPIVIDEENIVLGGNMRLKALKELNYDEIPDNWIKRVEDLSEDEKKEFIVKDNVNFGEWEYELLKKEWEIRNLEHWAVDITKEQMTEMLSGLEYKSIYYEPKEKPYINLEDCLDLEKFDRKVKIIEESGLDEEKKKILKYFAYRFIKIDFENVANYYYFNATEEEEKIIERLRLVLIDNSINGFIEDELLKINEALWSGL